MSHLSIRRLSAVSIWWLMFLVLVAAVILAIGCGQEPRREIFEVEGWLTVNGSPAGNASIAFHPLGGAPQALCPVGRTDAEGKFRLTTHSRFDGAPPGDYAVTVIWLEDSSVIDECSCTDLLKHDRLKGFYSDADKTEFRVTVGRSAKPGRNPKASWC